jgi:hypothetical protein
VTVALVMVLPPRLRGQAAWLGVLFVSVVGIATLSAGWHRPSDPVAAFLLVGAWAAVAGAVVVAASGSDRPVDSAGSHPDTPRRLLRASAGLLVSAALLGTTIVAADLDRYGTSAQVLAYLAGAAAIACTAAMVMASVLVITRWIAQPVGRTPGTKARHLTRPVRNSSPNCSRASRVVPQPPTLSGRAMGVHGGWRRPVGWRPSASRCAFSAC